MSGYGGYYDYGRGADPAMAAYQQRMMEMQRAGYNPPPQYQPVTAPPPLGYRYDQMQQVAPQMPIPKIRIVTSVEEARAAQVDLDGTPTFFRSPAEGKIYEKSIGLDGLPVFNTYQRAELSTPQQQQNATAVVYADSKTVQDLQARVTQLENFLKGVAGNVQSNANDATDGATPKQQ